MLGVRGRGRVVLAQQVRQHRVVLPVHEFVRAGLVRRSARVCPAAWGLWRGARANSILGLRTPWYNYLRRPLADVQEAQKVPHRLPWLGRVGWVLFHRSVRRKGGVWACQTSSPTITCS